MSGIRLSNMDQRLAYNNAVEVCKRNNVDPVAAGLTPATLRLEQQLATNKTQYQFGVINGINGPSGTQFNTEVRLNQQDSYFVSQIAFRIGEPSAVNDATYVDCTYPSPAIFSASGEAAALEVLYKSQLKITVNGVVKIPTLHLGRFRKVQFAQKVAAAANQNGIANDSIDGATEGIMICEPNIVLIGSKNNLIEIDLPAAITTIGTAGFTRMILEFRGLNAQNSTIIV